MNRRVTALSLLTLWVAGLAVAGAFVVRRLDVEADLRLFLPSATTPEQRLLLEAIGEGPASRLLVVAIEGAEPETLADASRALVDALRGDERFRFVANGEAEVDSLPEDWLPYRYLVATSADARSFDRVRLRAALESRLRDLASPGGFALESLIARDPTFVLPALLERWQPAREPRREHDVWFDAAGTRALIVAETRAAAFDPEGQREALAAVDAVFARADAAALSVTVSGTGRFSVLMEDRTRATAESLARTATILMLIVLLFAYRRAGALVFSALPLASAAVAGLAAVSAVFGTVHGITLAFGFTLLGVAQDYPLHLLSHRRPGVEPAQVARTLWPPLITGIASTSVAYLTFWFSGVTGLKQLACFTVTGLAVAGATTRWLLPPLMSPGHRDYGASAALARLASAIAALPRPRWAPPLTIAACVGAAALAPQPFWDNDLGTLTPVPQDLLERDRELKAELRLADARYLLVVEAATVDAALGRLEAMDSGLEGLVTDGAIAAFEHAARYVPSAAAQRARQAELPSAATLRAELNAALAGTAFRPDAFEPFVADVQRARTLPPFTLGEARASPAFGAQLDALLVDRGASYAALVTFTGVRDVAALEELAEQHQGVTLLDIRAASQSLVAAQRTRMLESLGVGFLLLIGIVAVALRDAKRVYRVLAPLTLTTFVVIAALQLAGVSLNVFHLISLILAAGLGLDYALFFEHAAGDDAEQRRTLHAVLVCATTTLMVFALLATAELPVLRAIGAPVALGVVTNFVLALLLTRPAPRIP
jgi:predicted exporter